MDLDGQVGGIDLVVIGEHVAHIFANPLGRTLIAPRPDAPELSRALAATRAGPATAAVLAPLSAPTILAAAVEAAAVSARLAPSIAAALTEAAAAVLALAEAAAVP